MLRAGRRTLLTALGVAAAMTSLVTVLGLGDTFRAAGDANATEVEHSSPDRLVVGLDTFHPTGSRPLRSLEEAPGVAQAVPQLAVPATLRTDRGEVDAVLEVVDLDNPVWSPTLQRDTGDDGGIVLSEKAADDLGVRPGDTIAVRHPDLGAGGLRLVTSDVAVRALHPDPWRTFSYLDGSGGAALGLAGIANQVVVVPAGDREQLRRALFRMPGVTSVEPASSFAEAVDTALEQFTGILRVIEVATLLLALLIAFNAASITADERRREHATMFAFGLPPRVVVGTSVIESAVTGLLGTLAGIAGGYAALRYVVAGFDDVTPELLVVPTVSIRSLLATLALGVLVVALAPLLGIRRERRMDIPATLRVVE